MAKKRITREELKQVLASDFERLVAQMADVMNAAEDGHIIAETEEEVRDANAVFRQRAYEKAVRLLQDKQEAFSPSASRPAEQRQATDPPSDR